MNNTNKSLAYGIWAITAIWLIISIIGNLSVGMTAPLMLILTVAAHIFQFLLGVTIYREKNDGFTMVMVVLVAIFTFNLGGFVAIIQRLIIRKNNSQSVRNSWFLPAVVSGVLALISLFTVFSILNLFGFVLNVAYYAVFGYWFIKLLPLN